MNIVFQFPDLQSFLWMDGHGPYVWSCYVVTFVGMAYLALEPKLQKKKFINQQRRAIAIRKAQEQAEG